MLLVAFGLVLSLGYIFICTDLSDLFFLIRVYLMLAYLNDIHCFNTLAIYSVVA